MENLCVHRLAEYFFLPPINGLWIALIIFLKWRSRIFVYSWLFLSIFVVYIQYTPYFAAGLTKLIYPELNQAFNAAKIKPQAIVVLGAGFNVELNEAGTLRAFPAGYSLLNIESTAKVALENPRLPIFLSGGGGDDSLNEAQAMSYYLKSKYSLINTQVLEDKSIDTNENARFTALKLKDRKIDRVILVTQASHMWRSQLLFSKYGIKTIPYPAWDSYYINDLNWWQKISPYNAAVEQTEKVLHEIIGYVAYAIF